MGGRGKLKKSRIYTPSKDRVEKRNQTEMRQKEKREGGGVPACGGKAREKGGDTNNCRK